MTKPEENQSNAANQSTAASATSLNPFLTHLQQTALKELQKFTGEPEQKISQFINAIEHIGSFTRLDDNALHALATIKLGGLAFNWYDNNKDTLTTWQLLKTHLRERFQQSISSAKTQLKTRTQQPDESLASFYDAVIDLCTQVDPNMPLYMIIDYLQDGVRDDLKIHIKRRLRTLDTDIITPALFLKIARDEEELQKEVAPPSGASSFSQPFSSNVVAATRHKPATTTDHRALPSYSSNRRLPTTTPTFTSNRSSYRNSTMSQQQYRPCLICNRSNHRTLDCFHKQPSGCFKCGISNHSIRDCPQVFR